MTPPGGRFPSGGRRSIRSALVAVFCLCILSALTLALPAPAPGQENVSIQGRVVNGTDGAGVPGDLAVLMLITGPDGTLSGTGQSLLGPDGSFVLEDVPVMEGALYTISVDYDGVFYSQSLLPGQISGDVVVTVFEATEDAQIIRVDRQVMVLSDFDVAQRMGTVTEFVRFANPTDRTLRPNLETARPGMFSFMRFALPPEASDVTVQSSLRGGDVISVGTGFALAVPVPPGEHSVDFAYTFPYEGGSLDFRNSLPQGAGIFQVLVPARWDNVEIRGLVKRDPVAIGDEIYRAWEARDVPAGPGVEIRLDGLPQPGIPARLGATLSGGQFWITAIPSAMGVILFVLLVLGLLRRYRPEPAAAGTGGSPDAGSPAPSPTRRAEVVANLAALDEQYHRGAIEANAYFRRRASLVSAALSGDPEQGP